MKKLLALILAVMMALTMAASAEAVKVDDIPDTMNAENGVYGIQKTPAKAM